MACASKYPIPGSQAQCDARANCPDRGDECKFLPYTIFAQAECICSDGLDCHTNNDCPHLYPECVNGRCTQDTCSVNTDCLHHGDGWVCLGGTCTEVTSSNCVTVVQSEGYDSGVWGVGTYSTCLEHCVLYCGGGCSRASTGGTWGECCGFSC